MKAYKIISEDSRLKGRIYFKSKTNWYWVLATSSQPQLRNMGLPYNKALYEEVDLMDYKYLFPHLPKEWKEEIINLSRS